jgi:histidine ammonia-lyase
MTGLSCLAIADATRLLQWADVIGAMSFEAQRGQIDAFDPRSSRSNRTRACSRSGATCVRCSTAAK